MPESQKSVYVSIGCDLGIAAAKFVTAGVTASASMFSEGIHSLVDSANGFLLLWGRRASHKAPDFDHPFGYGKELYFWTLIVAVMIFGIGGGVSIYEGAEHVAHHKMAGHVVSNYVVLSFAAVFEAATIVVAARDFRRTPGRKRGFWAELRASKDPTIFTILLDNGAALAGLLIAFLGIFCEHSLHIAFADGLASILIGITLAAVAVLLAIESKGLLVGEGVDKQTLDNIRTMVKNDPGVVQVGPPLTMYFGPQSILLALDVQFERGLSAGEVTATVDRIEKNIRTTYPNIQRIFIEAEALTPGTKNISDRLSRTGEKVRSATV